MAEKTISPALKSALELGPTLLFFALYMWIKDDSFTVLGRDYSGFIVSAVLFVPILLLSILALWKLTGELSRMQVFTGVVVVFFGGLTAWFNDESFFKMKTTLVYSTFAALLGIGLVQGKSYLKWALGAAMPLEDEGWMILTRRFALAFVILAIANEVVWRTQSNDTWVWIETFLFPAALVLFTLVQVALLGRYVIEPDKSDKRDPG